MLVTECLDLREYVVFIWTVRIVIENCGMNARSLSGRLSDECQKCLCLELREQKVNLKVRLCQS